MTRSTILDRIVEVKRGEVASLRPQRDDLRARARDAGPTRGFAAALRRPGEVRLLAEVKRRSPSAGDIRPGADPAEIAEGYARAGAAAISVLTDREFFGGTLEALARVRAAVDLPALRKDFLVDPLQVWEARAAGADAVLLIVRLLSDGQLTDLLGLSGELGLDTLVEVHTADEVARALSCGAEVIGVNNRDLAVFRTDLELTPRLARLLPEPVTLVAESGIRTAADVDRMGACGVDAVLVGESLMREPDPGAAAARLVGRPRLERPA